MQPCRNQGSMERMWMNCINCGEEALYSHKNNVNEHVGVVKVFKCNDELCPVMKFHD